MNPLYIIVSLALLGLVAADAGQKGQLEKLCRSGKGAPEVTTISEVRSMIDLLKSDHSVDCAPEVREAIMALEPIIELESVCSEQAADAIVAFWAKYLDKKSKLKKHLPKKLRKFYIGVGLQVSKVCKQTLVEQLEQASQEKGISEEDIDVVTRALRESEELKVLFGNQSKLESLVAVVRTDSAKDADGKPKDKKGIKLEPKQAKLFELVQKRCINKFKPIYDTLISPIVRLAAIGLSNGNIGEFEQTKVYQDWFKVVVACEPFANHELIVVPVSKLNAAGDTAMVTILDEDELAELRKEMGLTQDEPEIAEPVDYKIQVRIDNVVVEPQLVSSIAGYGKGLKEITKIKLRMVKRLPTLIKYIYQNSDKVKIGLKSYAVQKKTAALAKYGGAAKQRLIIAAIGLGLAGAVILAMILLAHPLTILWAVLGCVTLGILTIVTAVLVAITQ